jgi:hypothetical protein
MTNTFAHLLGLGSPSAAKPRAEDDDDKKKRDEEEAAAAKKKADEDESDEEMRKKAAAKKKAEDDDQKDDDKDDRDDDDKSKAATLRERARCAAIFASPAAGVRPDMAGHLAFKTGMSTKDAIASLEVSAQGFKPPAAAGRTTLADRMTLSPNPDLGSDADATALKPHQRLAAAHAKATGQKQ